MRKYIVLCTILLLLDVSVAGYIAYWRDWFWAAVNNRNLHEFIILLTIFGVVTLASCFITSWSGYCQTMGGIEWRRELVAKYLPSVEKLVHVGMEGYKQRIQQDTMEYPQLVFSLGYSGVQSVLYVIIHTYIIISTVPLLYLILPVIFTVLWTILSHKVASPLINLNYQSQCLEAKFRESMDVNDYNPASDTNELIAKVTKWLSYFQSFYGQASVILPLIALAPAYFSNHITFGQLMQNSSAIGIVLYNLSWGINCYTDINRLRSCHKRLQHLVEAV